LYKSLAEAGSELPPLGLATVAAVTRQEGYNTLILDALALGMNSQETVEWILKENPDYVGITSVTKAIFNAADVAKLIKKHNSKIKIIIGGPHVTAVPIETFQRFKEFDIGVFGEGEETIVELLQALDSQKDLKKIKGLILRDGKKIILTERRPYIKDLDKLPFPAWDLLPDLLKYYQPAADTINRFPATLLVTSRGCPYQCIFCDRSVFGNVVRGFSADYIIKMINHLQKTYGIKELFIEDDNFLVLRKRLVEFCNKIIEEKIDITWSCLGRVDNVDEEILKLMKKAGCWQINYGFESGSQRILDIINKKIKVEDSERAVAITRKAGIKVKGLFMMGNFGETKESISETINFIKRMPITDFHMTCFTPMPNTKAWEEAPKYGWFNPDWRKISAWSVENFIPKGFTREDIEKYYRKCWKTFYFKPPVIWDYLKKLKNNRMRKKIIKSSFNFIKFVTEK